MRYLVLMAQGILVLEPRVLRVHARTRLERVQCAIDKLGSNGCAYPKCGIELVGHEAIACLVTNHVNK